MLPNHDTTEIVARDLIDRHGPRARQQVVDRIVSAIREHDIEAAKQWEVIGHAVDRRLDA
jgi:hypothetical protein